MSDVEPTQVSHISSDTVELERRKVSCFQLKPAHVTKLLSFCVYRFGGSVAEPQISMTLLHIHLFNPHNRRDSVPTLNVLIAMIILSEHGEKPRPTY